MNELHPQWKDYGGRGITVCPEWKTDFDAFIDHIGLRPTPLHTLDRIDNNRGYEPGNVRWATRMEQQSNLRSNHLLTHPRTGETLTKSQWTRRCGFKRCSVINGRLKMGWPLEKILDTPVISPQPRIQVKWRGRTKPLSVWLKQLGINASTYYARRQRGWTEHEALGLVYRKPFQRKPK